jgi:hypothetical protein
VGSGKGCGKLMTFAVIRRLTFKRIPIVLKNNHLLGFYHFRSFFIAFPEDNTKPDQPDGDGEEG